MPTSRAGDEGDRLLRCPAECAEMCSSIREQISWSRDESQRIAVWRLLYRLRHPDRELSRLRMISRPDVARDVLGRKPRPRLSAER